MVIELVTLDYLPVLGVVQNEDAIVEIKCFPSLVRKNQDIVSAIKTNKNFPIVENNGVLSMKETHDYYYQVNNNLICFQILHIISAYMST